MRNERCRKVLQGTDEEMISHLVIVAGGPGTRLAEVAGDLPKALVPVGGKAVLQHQLELASASGITHVDIFAGFQGEKIQAFVGDGSKFGLTVRVFIETKPLGNAGAVLCSLGELPEHFFVLYGDVMVAADLGRLARRHLSRAADFTTFVHPNDHPHDSDLLEIDSDDWVVAIRPYPHPRGEYFSNIVNAAVYAVRRDALLSWSANGEKLDFTKNIITGLIAAGKRVLAYRSEEYVKDMGTPHRLKVVEADFLAGEISLAAASQKRPTIFLDRDGTLNIEKGFLRSVNELELYPNVGSALRSLRKAGFRLVVITNQPVIARGEASEAEVAAIHRRLEWELGQEGAYLDRIYICPHHPDRGFPGERLDLKISCNCRKPSVGLVEQASTDLNIDLASSWMIGDRTLDIELARRAGMRSILVLTGAAGLDQQFEGKPDLVARDFVDAARLILQHQAAS